MKKIVLVVATFLTTIINLSSQENIKIESFVLDNGLKVFLNQDKSVPEVFGCIMVRAGSKDDPADATGMAHYMEHMLFKGTTELGTIDWESEKVHIDNIFSLYDELSQTKEDTARQRIQKLINEQSLKAGKYAIPNEMSNVLRSIGGTNMNAGTGPDYTVYYNAFPPTQIEKWLELYSHRFTEPVFRGFQAELEVVYEEKNMYSDMFIFSLIKKFNEQFFKNHPYGQKDRIGTLDDLKNPSLTKMYKFLKDWYVANNMALVISGNFDVEKVTPLIKEKFSKLKKGSIPQRKEYKEEPFNGREYCEAKLSPIKIGLLGYRTVKSGHPDEIALEICSRILSNSNETGLLDQLSLDGKLLTAQVLPMIYNDHGATVILVVPKILGQKLEDAEQLIHTELAKLKNGDFDKWMVDAIKKELYIEHQTSLEDIEGKAVSIADYYAGYRDVNDLLDYPEQIKKVGLQEVLDVANKYFGDDFLAFYSKMGFPKKEEIDKPGYEPVVANTDAISSFTKHFNEIEARKPNIEYIDFAKEVSTLDIAEGLKLYTNKNSVNDIFNIQIRYGVGNKKMPLLEYASQIMNYAGVDEFEVMEFKKEFSKIGCSYNVYSDDDYTYYEIEGLDESLGLAIDLITKLINGPKLDPEKLDIIVQGEQSGRRMEKSEPDNVASALFEYVRYKEKSSFLDRLTMKEVKELNTDSLLAEIGKVTDYGAEIHYVGSKGSKEVADVLKSYQSLGRFTTKSESPVIEEPEVYKENIVYFVNKKKAVQSKIFLFVNGQRYSIKDKPIINAFNMYFGGGFSGLVLQEVREYRSLAYSAGAIYRTPAKEGAANQFIGYVGTQADKTLEALNIFYELLTDMPQKEERMEMIKLFLEQSAMTSKPGFREMSKEISDWIIEGYTADPRRMHIPEYLKMEFNDIVEFYQKNIKDKPIVFAFVGNKKRIDMKEVEKYGKIIEIKEKALFRK